MSRTYELWDVETGNVIGEFPSSDSALEVVRTLLDANGIEMADALVLQSRDDNASVRIVGRGSQLVDEVNARIQTSSKVPART